MIEPRDETLWHEFDGHLWFPRRSVDGGWIGFGLGQIWRRKVDGKWQYRQDEETYEQFLDRQY